MEPGVERSSFRSCSSAQFQDIEYFSKQESLETVRFLRGTKKLPVGSVGRLVGVDAKGVASTRDVVVMVETTVDCLKPRSVQDSKQPKD